MKRLLTVLSFIFMISLLCVDISAGFDEYEGRIKSELSGADTSDISGDLADLGIDPDDPESAVNLSPSGLISFVFGIFRSALARLSRLILTSVIFAAVCKIATSLSFKAGLYGEIFVMLCFIAVAPETVTAFTSAVNAMRSCHAFMLTYIPSFAGIVAASGNVTAAVSYNAIVLYFCEAAAFLASSVLKPILCCMLVMSVTQAISPDLYGLTAAVRSALTTIIGFIMTVFLGVISLETIVGRGADGIAVRAGKYAISSFVPIIGYSLSESYKAVSLSLGAIRTAVGVFGIIVLFVYMITPIIHALVYKISFRLCSWICRLTGADRIAAMMSGIADVFGFCGTVLTVFMLMLTVSTGMLIILGGVMA